MALFWISLVWVVAAACVPLLQGKQQVLASNGLVALGVILVALITFVVGWFLGLLGLVAVVSMFPAPFVALRARVRNLTLIAA